MREQSLERGGFLGCLVLDKSAGDLNKVENPGWAGQLENKERMDNFET
jgi:hypothetical protein